MAKASAGSPVAGVPRLANGQFPAGVSGNPAGRPLGKRNEITDLTQDLEIALRRGINTLRVQNIVNQLITQAEQGSIQAARLILDKVLPNAASGGGETESVPALTIVIKNATHGALSGGESPTNVRVIEHEAVTTEDK